MAPPHSPQPRQTLRLLPGAWGEKGREGEGEGRGRGVVEEKRKKRGGGGGGKRRRSLGEWLTSNIENHQKIMLPIKITQP